jgi:hypothetical protein
MASPVSVYAASIPVGLTVQSVSPRFRVKATNLSFEMATTVVYEIEVYPFATATQFFCTVTEGEPCSPQLFP